MSEFKYLGTDKVMNVSGEVEPLQEIAWQLKRIADAMTQKSQGAKE